MGVVLSEDPIEAGSACSEFLADPPRPVNARATSLWFLPLAPLIFAFLAIIECLPLLKTGLVVLALALGPIAVVGAIALLAAYY